MAIGDTITQPIPAASTPGTTYAAQLVAFLQEVKSRLEAKVPLSSLLVGLLDMDNNAVENVQHVGLYEQANTDDAPIGGVVNVNGELWFVSSAGDVQLTSAGGLNASGIGGIEGDYGGVNPAKVRFSDGDTTYYFYDDYANAQWARLAARSIDLYGTLTETERVRIAWDGGSNWTLTLPSGPPAASGTLLQMDTSGNVTAANTGLDSITLNANETVTAADFKFVNEQTVRINAAQAQTQTGGPTFASGAWIVGTNTAALWYPITLRTGEVIKSWTLFLTKGSASGTVSASLWRQDSVTGVGTQVGSTQSNSAASAGNVVLSQTGLNETVSGDTTYYLAVTGGGTAGDTIRDLQVNVTKP